MGFFKNDKKGKPPHTWHPDILHWREGDKIFCWNVGKAIGYMKARQADLYKYMEGVNHVTPYGKGMFNYKSVDEQGNIYLDYEGETVTFEFWRFIKVAKNETLESRKLEDRVKNSEKYMELMSTFQHAFDELQEADDHPVRLGESKKEKE